MCEVSVCNLSGMNILCNASNQLQNAAARHLMDDCKKGKHGQSWHPLRLTEQHGTE